MSGKLLRTNQIPKKQEAELIMLPTRNLFFEKKVNAKFHQIESLREEIIESHKPLAISRAKKFWKKIGSSNIDFEDLVQTAMFGLVNAANRFDPGRGNKFSTFAMSTIDGEIKRWLRDNGFFNMLKRKHIEVIPSINRIRENHSKSNPNSTFLSDDYLASELAKEKCMGQEPSEKDVQYFLSVIKEIEMYSAVIPLDAPISESTSGDAGAKLMDSIEDSNDPYEQVSDKILAEQFMDVLPARLKFVIKMYFFERRSEQEIAECLGCSQMNVNRLKHKAIGLMRSNAKTIESP